MSARLDQWKQELESWREISLGADFEQVSAADSENASAEVK
jgi:hypothetical protein